MVDLHDAWSQLGIAPTDDAGIIRAAFLRRLHMVHPDVSSAHDANASTFALTSAYRVILDVLDERPVHLHGDAGPAPPPEPMVVVPIAMVDGDTIAVALPGADTYQLLVEAAHRLGEVTHIEPSAGMLQVIVEFVEAPVSQMLMTLQGRATGVTEIFCTIESLENEPAPPISAVTRLLMDELIEASRAPLP